MKKLFIILFILTSFILNAQTKGTFIDIRDNKTYKTIKIGDQIWMNEDLKYNDTTLYNYQVIMNGTKPDTNQIKGICPYGWHVPNVSEWYKLLITVGRQNASEKLRDYNGFHASMNGRYNFDKKLLENKGSHSYYWTSTERDQSTAWVYFIYEMAPSVNKIDGDKNFGYSLRCIKNF